MERGIKDKYKVIEVTKDKTDEWLLHKHYAKRKCSIMKSFALEKEFEILGVCTFGMPPTTFMGNLFDKGNYMELNRLVTNDNLEKNVLSYFVSSALKRLGNMVVISYADPNKGHNGYIYQATNFIYTGKSLNTTQLVDKEGNEVHHRNIGHYQKNNKLNAKLVKRRLDEKEIDRVEIAEYLREHKGEWTARQLDKVFGHKDTAAHWFRTDAGFSFPNVDDWLKLKELLNLDDTYDDIMTAHEWVPCPQDIIRILELEKVEIKPKHRYFYVNGSKGFRKRNVDKINNHFGIYPYPKGKNTKYDASYEVKDNYVTATLFNYEQMKKVLNYD